MIQVRKQIDDKADMIFVWMQEFGTTSGNDESHILKTIGVATCIAVTLYDSQSKVGSMAHISAATDIENLREAFQGILDSMRRAGYQEASEGEMEIRILGGWQGCTSDELLMRIKSCLSSLGLPNVVEQEYSDDESKCIALDTRTGELFDLVNIIPMSITSTSEKEKQIERLRELRAMLPLVHYTYDERAKPYEIFVIEKYHRS